MVRAQPALSSGAGQQRPQRPHRQAVLCSTRSSRAAPSIHMPSSSCSESPPRRATACLSTKCATLRTSSTEGGECIGLRPSQLAAEESKLSLAPDSLDLAALKWGVPQSARLITDLPLGLTMSNTCMFNSSPCERPPDYRGR